MRLNAAVLLCIFGLADCETMNDTNTTSTTSTTNTTATTSTTSTTNTTATTSQTTTTSNTSTTTSTITTITTTNTTTTFTTTTTTQITCKSLYATKNCAAGYRRKAGTDETVMASVSAFASICCEEIMCNCTHGEGAAGRACPIHGGTKCAKCNSGYTLSSGGCEECAGGHSYNKAAYTVIKQDSYCDNSSPSLKTLQGGAWTTAADCADAVYNDAQCSNAFVISGDFRICDCVRSGSTCIEKASPVGSIIYQLASQLCPSGYLQAPTSKDAGCCEATCAIFPCPAEGGIRINTTSTQYSKSNCCAECVCENGNPATGADCFVSGPKCSSCNDGYYLLNNQCKAAFWEKKMTDCSLPCSGGTRTLKISCPTLEKHCEINNGAKPESRIEDCNTHACEWKPSEWEKCSHVCGTGSQQRLVTCPVTGKCDSDVPKSEQACNEDACCNEGSCPDQYALKPVGDRIQRCSESCRLEDCCAKICTESRCMEISRGLVVKADEAGRFCKRGQCTSEQCCAARAKCESVTCGATSKYMLDLPEYCLSTTCQSSECCAVPKTCASHACPDGKILKTDSSSVDCERATCTHAECCRDINMQWCDDMRSQLTSDLCFEQVGSSAGVEGDGVLETGHEFSTTDTSSWSECKESGSVRSWSTCVSAGLEIGYVPILGSLGSDSCRSGESVKAVTVCTERGQEVSKTRTVTVVLKGLQKHATYACLKALQYSLNGKIFTDYSKTGDSAVQCAGKENTAQPFGCPGRQCAPETKLPPPAPEETDSAYHNRFASSFLVALVVFCAMPDF